MMENRERRQIELIADHALSLFRSAVQERVASIFADHSAKGRLHSGATIRVSVRAMGELTNSFLNDLKRGIPEAHAGHPS